MAMLANRFPGIRAAVAHDVFSARTTVEMGNANIISLGERVLGAAQAWDLTRIWLASEFLGEKAPRYIDRLQHVDRITNMIVRSDWKDLLVEYLRELDTPKT